MKTIKETAKDQISYDKQVRMLGKEKADTALFYWMDGYKYREAQIQQKAIPEYPNCPTCCHTGTKSDPDCPTCEGSGEYINKGNYN